MNILWFFNNFDLRILNDFGSFGSRLLAWLNFPAWKIKIRNYLAGELYLLCFIIEVVLCNKLGRFWYSFSELKPSVLLKEGWRARPYSLCHSRSSATRKHHFNVNILLRHYRRTVFCWFSRSHFLAKREWTNAQKKMKDTTNNLEINLSAKKQCWGRAGEWESIDLRRWKKNVVCGFDDAKK